MIVYIPVTIGQVFSQEKTEKISAGCDDFWVVFGLYSLAGSLGLACIRPELTATILLLGPRNDANR